MELCRPFFYNGQGGNGNRFISDKECMKTCSSKFNELYPAAEAVCDMPVDHGTCMAMVLMYYYNREESNCRVFHYGGCQGNGNRFQSREECQQTCMAKAGRFGGPGQQEAPNPDQSTTSAGVVVAVLGGIIFTMAVIAAVVFFVKQRKQRTASDMEMN
ncbi:inter-alpha-trypsin inhibitor [Aplochiton taeniatus]